ncbi:hypothetical protein COLO4_33182 [Corchorus olitorius]|uniref:Uncharacterized protein n=1 Tax=Corchorus olitorius TaxID=93759 RepID=A0A1R3GVS3_9ROSI|nr:hypothetical protein COLO4_33182 [Corchorus olitorius]
METEVNNGTVPMEETAKPEESNKEEFGPWMTIEKKKGSGPSQKNQGKNGIYGYNNGSGLGLMYFKKILHKKPPLLGEGRVNPKPYRTSPIVNGGLRLLTLVLLTRQPASHPRRSLRQPLGSPRVRVPDHLRLSPNPLFSNPNRFLTPNPPPPPPLFLSVTPFLIYKTNSTTPSISPPPQSAPPSSLANRDVLLQNENVKTAGAVIGETGSRCAGTSGDAENHEALDSEMQSESILPSTNSNGSVDNSTGENARDDGDIAMVGGCELDGC